MAQALARTTNNYPSILHHLIGSFQLMPMKKSLQNLKEEIKIVLSKSEKKNGYKIRCIGTHFI